MSKEEIKAGFIAWYGHLTNWMAPFLVIALFSLGKLQWETIANGVIENAKTNKEILDLIKKSNEDDKDLHEQMNRESENHKNRIETLEFADADMATKMSDFIEKSNYKFERVYFKIKLSPDAVSN